MPEMKVMEFTDKLNLQPVTRHVPQPKAGEILIQVYATGGTPTEKLWKQRDKLQRRYFYETHVARPFRISHRGGRGREFDRSVSVR